MTRAAVIVLPLLLLTGPCGISIPWPPKPTPTPSPTPTPTPEPTPVPTPVPTPSPTVEPTPTPTPGGACSIYPSADAVLFIRNKPSGHGFDSSLRVKGDAKFCKVVTGIDNVTNCSLEGLPTRAACEMELMGGCPVWVYQKVGETTVYQCHDDQNAWSSCDHFGSPNAQDDPKTPQFEGQPAKCGEQRDALGPNAGFFTVAHGRGTLRACFANDPTNCGNWMAFDH